MLPPQSVRLGLALSIVGLIFGFDPVSEAGAQSIVRAGSESGLLGTPSGEQVWPAVAISAAGGWVVWEDNTIEGPRGDRGIAGARIGSDLALTGAPLRVNFKTAGSQEKPQVTMLADGNALVSWESRFGVASTNAGLSGRVITPTGSFASGEFRISPGSTVTNVKSKVRMTGIFRNRTQTRTYKFKEKHSNIREHAGGSSLVALPEGGAIVIYHGVRRTYTNTWTLVRQTKYNGIRSVTNDLLRPIRFTGDWMQDVYWQRVDALGRKVGAEVQVNQFDRYNQRDPSAALLGNGNVLVTWVSEQPRSTRPGDNFAVTLYAREMTAEGVPVGDEFAVGEDPTRASSNPIVAAVGAGGGFGIYWSQHEQVFSGAWNVYGRIFEAAGRPVSAPFTVNVQTNGNQYAPRLASTGAARIVVWTSVGQDGSREGVYGRTLIDGVAAGNEFQVNTTSASRQHQPVVGGVGDGRFIAIWSGYTGTSGFDLYSRVYEIDPAQQ